MDLEPIQDINLYEKDEDFSESIRIRIGEKIKDGLTPLEAGKRVGVSPARFKQWMNDSELFRNSIEGAVQERNATLKDKVLSAIEEVKYPVKRAQLYLDYLKHADKEFGAKHVNTKGIELKLTQSPVEDKKIEEELSAFNVQTVETGEDDNES